MNTLLFMFEVMDKEPTLLRVWLFSLFIGVGGFLLGRKHPISLFVILPFAFVSAWAHLLEIQDPFVGSAIVREAGYGYVMQSYAAISIAAVLPCLGALGWLRKKTIIRTGS